MKFQIIPVTPFAQNCSLIWCPDTMQGAVVDPGGDIDKILAAIDGQGVTVTQILLTHAHIDHAGATRELSDKLNLDVIGPHLDDKFWIEGLPQQAQMFGFPNADIFEPTRWLEDGDQVRVGNQTLDVVHCPGHTPGHVVFHHGGSQLAWVGDVLFKGSIGRTDFPKGDHPTLINSIKGKLWPLGGETRFIPGHGPMSDFAYERQHNPYVADSI